MIKRLLARLLVAFYHRGQTYKPNKPYTYHLHGVAECFENDENPDRYIIAMFHDIFEDTTCPHWLVRWLFGEHTYNVVVELTRPRDQSYFNYIYDIQSMDGMIVKLIDLQFNKRHAKGDPEYESLIPRYEKAMDFLTDRIVNLP